MVKVNLELDEGELKEFLDSHYGYEECDNMEYSEEETEQAIRDTIGCLFR